MCWRFHPFCTYDLHWTETRLATCTTRNNFDRLAHAFPYLLTKDLKSRSTINTHIFSRLSHLIGIKSFLGQSTKRSSLTGHHTYYNQRWLITPLSRMDLRCMLRSSSSHFISLSNPRKLLNSKDHFAKLPNNKLCTGFVSSFVLYYQGTNRLPRTLKPLFRHW